MNDEERIQQRFTLLQDSGWRAALTIFTGNLLEDRAEVWAHIDLDTHSIWIKEMLFDCGVLSGGEYRLVQLALSLFSQEIEVNLWKMLAGLDEENGQLAADAVHNFGAVDGVILHGDTIRKVLASKPIRKRATP